MTCRTSSKIILIHCPAGFCTENCATPDTLDGRVGVVGSGAGMTEFTDRKKHKFAASVD